MRQPAQPHTTSSPVGENEKLPAASAISASHTTRLKTSPSAGATFDNLILRGSLKQDIRDDVLRFFDARATYDEYGIRWKRGILFVGPPGNGKTHAVKALINSLAQPCLYVKNFRSPHGIDEMSIRAVFDRARRTAPCVVVLEDLDSLLTPENCSYFLNELDGFATNGGILTLATTNHPERLDPAVLDRPSRFDRKSHSTCPSSPSAAPTLGCGTPGSSQPFSSPRTASRASPWRPTATPSPTSKNSAWPR